MTERSIFARGIYEICRETFKDNKVNYLVYPWVGQSGKEPLDFVTEKFTEYDVIILVTSYSLLLPMPGKKPLKPELV